MIKRSVLTAAMFALGVATAPLVALLWPLWVGYLVISLLWGIGSIW